MKKNFLIISIIALLAIYGCGKKQNPIISTIEKEMGIKFNDDSKEGDRAQLYTFKFYFPNGLDETNQIKGIIDKTLNALPIDQNFSKLGSDNKVFDEFKWITPQYEIVLKSVWEKGKNPDGLDRDTRISIISK